MRYLSMPKRKRSKTSNRSTSNKNINIPPISKSEAGAATGAVLGAVGGPVGAVLGGAVGAMVGKRAESDKPMMPAVKRTARQAAGAMKAAVKTARVAVPAAKRIVKSVRPRKTSLWTKEIRGEKIVAHKSRQALYPSKDAGYPSEKALHGSENSITQGCAWQENAPLALVIGHGFCPGTVCLSCRRP